MPRPAIALVFTFLLSGCMVGERPPEGDSDGDYLTDEAEAAGWDLTIITEAAPCDDPARTPASIERHVNSSAQLSDTDYDGLDDGEEAQWSGDPRVADTDGDGLVDVRERDLSAGTARDALGHKVEFAGALRLDRADSDGDCLSDAKEVNGTLVADVGMRTTDPTVSDTDSDGYTDAQEVLILSTDPRNRDTDGDGASERVDVDPKRNVAVSVVFDRLRLASGGSTVAIALRFAYDKPPGEPAAFEPAPFNVTPGQASPIPADRSPGKVDVEDGTGVGGFPLTLSARREDTGAIVNLSPGTSDLIANFRVDPKAGTWKVGTSTGPADGRPSVLETADARLEFRLTVVAN